MRRIRAQLVPPMTRDVDRFFDQWANDVTDRINRALGLKQITREQWGIIMGLLFNQEEATELERILQRYYIRVIENSWGTLNLMIDSTADFSLTDPAVTRALNNAAQQVSFIFQTTQTAVVELLQFANDNGWSIEDVVNGRDGVPGLTDIIEETYANRGRAIARTELGGAQNTAAQVRFQDAGATHAVVFDNGFDNSHPFCRQVAGQIVTIEWMERNPLQHPNCVRAFGAVFGDVPQDEVFTQELAFGAQLKE